MNDRDNPLVTFMCDISRKLPLWLLLLLSFAGYCLLAIWFPLLPFYNQIPLLDIRTFTPSILSGMAYGLLIGLLFLLFILAFYRIRRATHTYGLAYILGISLLLALPLLVTYPINANDIYRYVIRGRIMSQFGDNPFAVPPADHVEDPLLPFAGEWAGETSPYGPIWELVAGGITALTGENLLSGLLAFKLLSLITFLTTVIVLWYLFQTSQDQDPQDRSRDGLGQPASMVVLWAWNPALLLIFIVDGHNDILMILGMLLGLLVIQKGFKLTGFFIMILAALVKPAGLLALPIVFMGLFREEETIRDKLRFVFLVAAGSILLAWLFFSPFGSALVLGQRLLREAASGASFSFGALLLLIARVSGIGLTAALMSGLGSFLTILFLLFAFWLLWRTWRGRSALKGVADIFLAYLVQALNFRIWYAAWPFPWLLLDAVREAHNRSSRFRLKFGLWFLFTSQLSVLIYGHMRIYFLNGSQLGAHLVGLFFTFIMPFILALLSSHKAADSHLIEVSRG